jgi:transglutaminase-like putative cysteine protease
MSRRAREIETLLLTMLAAAPLYFTGVVGPVPLAMFHVVMAGIAIRVGIGRGPELIPPVVMRVIAMLYIPFYVFDAIAISRSAIGASTHLVLFIAAYQPIESMRTNNQGQRLLTTALIFIASLATSTDISIVLFVLLFAWVMFRQLMFVSHLDSVRSVGRDFAIAAPSRSAIFYVIGTAAIAAALFPLIPRLKNPLVPGMAGALGNTSTGLSDSIDFNRSRTSTPDPAVVARVWMPPQTIPFFTPLRLKGTVYDAYANNEWKQTRRDLTERRASRNGTFQLARPLGFTRPATVQQRMVRTGRVYLPTGTYALSGLTQLFEGPTRESFMTFVGRDEVVSYQVSMSRAIEPLRVERVVAPEYPVTAPVAEMARQIVGAETRPARQAKLVEDYLYRNFQYVQNPSQIGRATMTTDEFLLRYHKGHCEYFAAGMVALMTSLNVPSRIVGGFYGGRLNPLTGYFVIRREDAHAWVEVWDGTRWDTYDPTPPSLRPGNTSAGLLDAYTTAISDSVNYVWDRYVLTYGLGDQIALFVELMTRGRDALARLRANLAAGARTVAGPDYLALLGFVIALGAVIVLVFRRRRPVFHLLADHLERLGVRVSDGTTMDEALARLRVVNPEAAGHLEPLIRLYDEERFSAHPSGGRVAAIRRGLAEMRM